MKEVEKLLDEIDVNCPECDNPCKTMVYEVEACKTNKYKQLIIAMIKSVDDEINPKKHMFNSDEFIAGKIAYQKELKTKLIDIIKRKV